MMQVLPDFFTPSLQQSSTYALLEDSKSDADHSSNLLFSQPEAEIIAYELSEIDNALTKIDELKKQGLYLCGYLAYEAGYHFIDKAINNKIPDSNQQPLLYFIAFKSLHHLTRKQLDNFFNEKDAFPTSNLCVHDLQLNVRKEEYLSNIARIKSYIEAGDTYQINYTIKYKFKLKGCCALLYKALRKTQPVEFGALLNFPKSRIISLSPELFVYKKDNALTSKPMKGTAQRGKDKKEDNEIINFLKHDPKTLSENVMIVDLIRNDFGRICETGSVNVTNLFEVQTFKSIHQMISTVKGTLLNDLSFADILSALYPCGSITGAPKLRTMEIINELETEARGVYTGAIGYILPNDDFHFNVPIRTIVINEKDSNDISTDCDCEMGIGSGIIHESNAQDEFAECLLKANFLKSINNHFYLIEAFKYNARHNKFIHLDRHLQRLSDSANYFGFKNNLAQTQKKLSDYKKTMQTDLDAKVRLCLYQTGDVQITHSTVSDADSSKTPKRVKISKQTIDSNSIFQYHKTSQRTHYNRAFEKAEKDGFYDVIFFNEKDQLAEASRHNIFIKKGGHYFTPPISSGILNGIERDIFIKTHHVTEKHITKKELFNADNVLLSNSVRGIVHITLL